MRLRRRREKPKAAPAPRRGSGAGTFCVKSVVKADSLRPAEAVKFCETAIVFVLLANVLTAGEERTSAVKAGVIPVMVEVTAGLPEMGPLLPLTLTEAVLKVNGVPVMATLYFNVPLTVPVVWGVKSVWTLHTPSYSVTEILSPGLAVKPVSEKPVKFLSPISPPQVARLLKKHSKSPAALDSPALINAAVESRRAAPVRERLIPDFSLKLTRGEFMIG